MPDIVYVCKACAARYEDDYEGCAEHVRGHGFSEPDLHMASITMVEADD